MGLFEKEGSDKERSAWVRAKTECEVAELSYAKFRELTQQDPDILYALGSQMAERLRNTTRKVGDRPFSTLPAASRCWICASSPTP